MYTSIYMFAQYAHSCHTPSQLTNTCSELDSSLLAPSNGLFQVLQYPPFGKICILGTLSYLWLAGSKTLIPFCRETLSRLPA